MAGKTTAHTDAVLNVLRNVAVAGEATPHIGLFSVNPADDGAAGTELTGAGGYARQPVTFSAPEAGTGQARRVRNSGILTFGPATGSDWAQAVGFGIFTALSAGSLRYWDSLTTPKTVAVGDRLEFAVNALEVVED